MYCNRDSTQRTQYMFGAGKMQQNGCITGHAGTERNGRCGTYKKEAAGSNPASPTYRTRAYCNPNGIGSGSRHGSKACFQRVECGILQDLQTPAKASGLLSASTRLSFRTSANRSIWETL